MADEGFGDESGDYFFDEDYLYIEDEYAIADELAEGQVPSPGYSGTNAELAAESYDWDNYEFWSDLAYGSDSYFDPESKAKRQKPSGEQVAKNNKRKRTSVTTRITKDKRRRVTIEQKTVGARDGVVPENVIFRGNQSPLAGPPTPDSMESFALLPDWKTQFPADADIEWQTAMPEDMKKAAEANDEDTEAQDQSQDETIDVASPAISQETGVKSRKRKAVRNAAHSKEESEAESAMASLDPDTLRMILKQKLGGSGVEESAFMSVIQEMLAGGGADDAAEQLTRALLNGEGADSSTALEWLGQQGVDVDGDAEELDDGEPLGKRVDSGAGLPAQSEVASHNKRKARVDPGTSSVEASPIKQQRPTTTTNRSARKKSKT